MKPYQLRTAQPPASARRPPHPLRPPSCSPPGPLGAHGATGCGPPRMPPEVPALLRATVETPTLPAAWKEVRPPPRLEGDAALLPQERLPARLVGVNGPLPRAQALLDAIGVADAEGLDVGALRPRPSWPPSWPPKEPNWDLRPPRPSSGWSTWTCGSTSTFLTLAAHVASGRVQPETLRIDWYTKPRNVDLGAALARAIEKDAGDGGALAPGARRADPAGTGYTRLRQEHARLLTLANQGGWPRCRRARKRNRRLGATGATGATGASGATGPAVGLLRARLAASGDLPHGQVAVSGAAGSTARPGRPSTPAWTPR